jgi:hypothetical protein
MRNLTMLMRLSPRLKRLMFPHLRWSYTGAEGFCHAECQGSSQIYGNTATLGPPSCCSGHPQLSGKFRYLRIELNDLPSIAGWPKSPASVPAMRAIGHVPFAENPKRFAEYLRPILAELKG